MTRATHGDAQTPDAAAAIERRSRTRRSRRTPVAAGAAYQPRFDGIVRLHSAREVAAQQGTIQPDYTVARTAAEGVLFPASRAVRAGPADHDLRPVFARPGGGDEADGDRSHLPGRLGHLGEGVGDRGPRSGPRELPARARSRMRRPDWFERCSPPTGTSTSPAPRWTRSSGGRRRTSTFARSSSPTPTRATAVTPTFGTSSVDSSRSACRATTSRTRSRAPRSAATRPARSWSPRTSRTSGSMPRGSSWTSCGCRASSSPGPTPSRRRSSTTAATSGTSRSSWGRRTSSCPATGSASSRS